jgi:hypothetical protein
MTDDSSNMVDKLTGFLDEKKTPEEIGSTFGNMMTNMMKVIQETPIDGNPEECTQKIFGAIFGKEIAERIAREQKIRTFLQEILKTHSLTESIVLAKNEFNLPDDFTIKLSFDVTFSPASV